MSAGTPNPYGADPSDPDSFVGGVPHETFARVRAEAPVFFHADVWRVSLDAKTFSSERATALDFRLGSHLARLEIRVMPEEVLRRLPDIRLARPVARPRSDFINGVKQMPVAFTPDR